ncbi:phosphoketolase [Streptomyces sp. NPDC059568]|uniref:phosphoketolase family protein n=1 Tax=Streptomyces sp. NPDC059568 TaxID=3346868 RepID=UPI0036C27723
MPDTAVGASWRALNYLCAAQLYLADNPLLFRPLQPVDVKESPRGHWGVCPPVNWMLAHLGPLTTLKPPGAELLVLHGAGHAGPAALARAYLNRTLDLTGQGSGWSMPAVRSLVAGFPHEERFGGEITPLIPGVRHTGGQLGPALAIAQGMVLDAPRRLVVPLIGDGELETGGTAAAWLGRRALADTGPHGAVLPVVLANGLRMGGPSLLGGMSETEVSAYFTGLGYTPLFHNGHDLRGFRDLLVQALTKLRPLGENGSHPVIVLTMAKGATGPVEVSGRRIMGTPAVHKTPLKNPRTDEAEFAALASWLNSYRPTELFTREGRPVDLVRQALSGSPAIPGKPTPQQADDTGASPTDVSAVIRQRAAHGAFRLFSPDEIASNRLRLSEGNTLPPWASEVLNEELCHGWLQGYTETGRDALLATYEAFAPVNTSLLVQHRKHLRLRNAVGETGLPSVNYLITSLGWRNTYTHQNPLLASSMLELGDPAVHVYTPADSHRAAAVMEAMLTSRDQMNLLIADKHLGPLFPTATLRMELDRGAAHWPHASSRDNPDIVLASAGEVPARQLVQAAQILREAHGVRLHYVHVNDLSALAPANADRPHAFGDEEFTSLFGFDVPVLFAVPTYPGMVRALLAARGDAARCHVVGYRDPGRPTTPELLLEQAGMSAEALSASALKLLKEHG